MSILSWQNYHFFFTFFQAAEPCPRPIHVLRRPKGLQFVSLIGGREIYIYIYIFFFFFFRGANKNGGTDRMRVGHAREERYAHGAEATTLELALVFSYARQPSSSRLSLIMRRTSLKEKKKQNKKCSTRFNLSCTIAAIRVKKQCHDAFYHLWIIKPVLQQIVLWQVVEMCCRKLR